MSRTSTTHLLSSLRQLMKNPSFVPKPLHAYIIPSEDAHQSEYTAECDQRRAFISGFTGSMATAVVTDTTAALWTDGRYYLQAEWEMDENWTLMKQGLANTLKEGPWLIQHFKEYNNTEEVGESKGKKTGCVVGADPLLLDHKVWDQLSRELTGAGHELVAVQKNLVDCVWGEQQPARPVHPVVVLEERWTGRAFSKKILDVRDKLRGEDCCALVLTALDDIAYLLNLRGSDISYNPVFFSYCLVTLDSCTLFIEQSKVSASILQLLQTQEMKVDIRPYTEFIPYLTEYCGSVASGSHVWLPNKCSKAVATVVPLPLRHSDVTPVALAKAIKNTTEISGMEACHVRDGAAVSSFLAWLEEEAPKDSQTEMTAAAHLEQCRAKQEHYRGLSFETISGVGSNAAIVHYRACPFTDKHITTKEIYLVDSGGHYSDGTTDVTRTVHFGTPSAAERDAFTRVLKGHIAMAVAVFPSKIKGNCLDSFARQYLWAVGLDYGHGTGHGVGMYLNVHEGPMGISWRVYPDDPGLQEGMFVSDEPGYYKNGEFGIRIESIVRIVKANTPHRHNDLDFLTFRATTLVPIQIKLIDVSLLTQQEVTWLNSYHVRVLEEVGAVLQNQGDQRAYAWLFRETQPITLSS
uniref:Xaa-Pro aminopeptidase 1-like n=1 Tax=Hirondellea gigas TaxID=1518452 RepID=A0A2P2HW66_9CRUS